MDMTDYRRLGALRDSLRDIRFELVELAGSERARDELARIDEHVRQWQHAVLWGKPLAEEGSTT